MAYQAPKEMWKRLEESEKGYEYLNQELSQPDVIADRKRFQELSQEHGHLAELTKAFREFRTNFEQYNDALELLKTETDPDMQDLAKMDISEKEPWLQENEKTLQILLLPKDPRDAKNCILELRQGVGGDEAGLFVMDMYKAYTRFSEDQGWRVEPMSLSENSAGGFKEIVASINGTDVFAKLKYESGVHRVQRVPKTESQGRVHTSTITVAVLPEADEVDVDIRTEDLRIDVMRAGGAGGQHVNTTDSAVRITHLPTNEVVICQDEKSQHKNKAKAMKVLRSRLFEKAQKEAQAKEAADRKGQVGGGFRNERIRTYNFPQGRVTDHRINMTTYNIDDIMAGELTGYISALANYYQTLELKGESAGALSSDD